MQENSDKVVMTVLRALVNIGVSVFYTGSIMIVFKHGQVNYVFEGSVC